MSYRSVICIYYPHQLLPALVALMHYRRYCLQETIEQSTLVYVKILIDNEQGNYISDAIQAIVKGISWISVKITYSWRLGKLREHYLPVAWRAFMLRRQASLEAVQEIFYAHDVSADFFTQTLMQAFPASKRICFGDSLGMVYTHDYFMALRYSEVGKLRCRLANLKRWFVLPSKRLGADKAILMLPCDPGGDFLTHIPLYVPVKADVKAVLDLLTSKFTGIDESIDLILHTSTKKIVFFALSNLNESKLATLDNELQLYQDIIDQHVPAEAILIIKPHPGTHESSLQMFKKRLKYRGEIVYLSKEFSVYPVELNPYLINRSDKILSISYTSISLPYLYDKPVFHVLTNELIIKYFNADTRQWAEEGNRQYLAMMAAIVNWEGNTPIKI